MTETSEHRDDPNSRIYKLYVSSGAANISSASVDSFQSRIPYLRRLVRTFFPSKKDAAILDLGCGYGALIYVANQEGYRNISGVDVSAEQVQYAKALGMKDITQSDLFSHLRTIPPASLDLVVAFDLIEHIKKSELIYLLDEVRRVLTDEGELIIHAPNAESPFFGRIRYGDFTHELAFTRTSIRSLLVSCGFGNVQSFEDRPIPHGLKSAVRYVLWKMLRSLLRAYLAIETGDFGKNSIFSLNFLTTASKRPSNGF